MKLRERKHSRSHNDLNTTDHNAGLSASPSTELQEYKIFGFEIS
jgi:hypothetical protein